MATKKEKKEQKQKAIGYLQESLPPGTKIYYLVRWVSANGMSRSISFFHCVDNQIIKLDYLISQALGLRLSKNGGVIIGGCGMDMGFHIIMNLSYCLHGFNTVGKDALESDKEGRPFTPKNGQYRAGYSFEYYQL